MLGDSSANLDIIAAFPAWSPYFHSIGLFLLGTLLIFFGANMLIDNSKLIAESYAVAPEHEKVKRFVIGVTIIAFGTSLPELVVSALASSKGASAIALGNVIGSNAANIGFVLATILLFRNIDFNFQSFKMDLNILIVLTLFLFFLVWFNLLNSLYIGLFFLLCFFLFMFLQFYELYYIPQSSSTDLYSTTHSETSFKKRYILLICIGITMLGFGSEYFISGAFGIAKLFNIPLYVVSLSIVAAGTSLPELVTSMIAIRKEEPNFVIGNVVGSNIINVLLVLGASICILPIDSNALPSGGVLNIYISISFVLLLTTIFYFYCYKFRTLGKQKGILLLLVYTAFLMINFYN